MTGPSASDRVWVAIIRTGIQMHAPNGLITRCGRSMRTGETILAGEAWRLDCTLCPRCWPDLAGVAS